MKISVLGSGSSGNSIYIENNNNKILIDAGFSGKIIKEKMEKINRNLDEIDGLLITHEHGDHILGAGILSRRHKIPIYITKESFIAGEKKLGKIEENLLNFLEEDFNIGDFKIKYFDVHHDATRTVAYIIEYNNKKIGIATDIGHADNIIKYNFQNLDVLIIESNYDHSMLIECGYPADLKARIKSNRGHFSNDDAGKFICHVHHDNLKKVYLVHLSKDSNTANTAYNTVKTILDENSINVDIEVVPQNTHTQLYHIK